MHLAVDFTRGFHRTADDVARDAGYPVISLLPGGIAVGARHARTAGPVRAAAAAGMAVLRRAAETVIVWHERARGRRLLAQMDARLRKDIGLDAVAAWHETNKPFWRS
jgi:uncharacterized protein YjiS (DUF1127 family)